VTGGRADVRLFERLAGLSDAARGDGRRRVVGIAGPPGAGKTTLVEGLLAGASDDDRLRGRVAHVPMDGFHLRDAELVRLGRRDRKGAPDTFDPAAYAAVLADLRRSPRLVVAAPAFDHAVGEPAPGGVTVDRTADVVLTEGNYLLLEQPSWRAVRDLLDEVWFCALDDAVRRDRLVSRHVQAGRERAEAAAWVGRSDEANARLVNAAAGPADVVVVDGRVVSD
jgi:pantothenate kinase